jgi:hypothetical protein
VSWSTIGSSMRFGRTCRVGIAGLAGFLLVLPGVPASWAPAPERLDALTGGLASRVLDLPSRVLSALGAPTEQGPQAHAGVTSDR